jgi:hypothetical protein
VNYVAAEADPVLMSQRPHEKIEDTAKDTLDLVLNVCSTA